MRVFGGGRNSADGKVYDAFVSYAVKDEDFVQQVGRDWGFIMEGGENNKIDFLGSKVKECDMYRGRTGVIYVI